MSFKYFVIETVFSHKMDFISKNPGLQHISEEIFLNLDHKSLLNCQKVNHFWEKTLNNNPSFWLKKCLRIGLSKEVEPKWIELIRTSKTENQKKIVSSTLNMNNDTWKKYF